MITLKTYIHDAIRLANSIVFKFEHINIYINYNLSINENIIITDKESSKYYLNMNGLPFQTDSLINTYVPDIDDYVNLTKDNITQYPLLRNDLLTKGTIYKTLMDTYRRETSLIKGIIRPIDIDTAINASDGTILQYDENLISDNEDSLIVELETFIKTMLDSYYNKKYNIDDYYLPGFISVIYNNLPLQILKIRLSKIFTREVDDYNLYTYLYSNKYIKQEDISFLNKESLIWLYGNIKHLNKNIGHNSTIDQIIDNVFNKNNIGVAKLNIQNNKPNISEDITNINDLMYAKNKLLISKKVNDSYTVDNEEYSLTDILDLEKELKLINEDDYDRLLISDTESLNDIHKDINSKVFLFDKVDIRILYNTSILNLIFNNLLYYVKQDNFNINTLFLDPNSNRYINLDKNGVFYILLYTMVSLSNKDVDDMVISEYNITGILNEYINIDDIIKNTILKDKLKPIVNDILKIITDSPTPTNTISFTNRINAIRRVYSKIWYYIVNTNDNIIASDLKIVFENFIKTITIVEDSNVTLRELVDTYISSDFKILEDVNMDTLVNICKDIFNLDLNEYINIENTFNNYINFVNKFKSYTIQFLYDTAYFKTIFTYSNSVTVGQQHRTIGNIYKSYFRKNNTINIILTSIATGYRDNVLYGNDYITPFYVQYPRDDINNLLANPNELQEYSEIYNINNNTGIILKVTQ